MTTTSSTPSPARSLPTSAERVARGKSARKAVPRASHRTWEAPSGRPDPVSLLEEQGASRVSELVPIRYGRMLTSAFAFYRGAALIMASDLAGLPRSGIDVQVCGDAHLSNFGVFASAERNLVFDVNDFDETLPGPWEWDVKRLTASLVVAGRSRDFSDKERAAVVSSTVAAYRTKMAEFAAMRDLDVWYTRYDVDKVLPELEKSMSSEEGKGGGKALAKAKSRADKNVAKARTRVSMQALSKLTQVVDGEIRFVSDPPLIVPLEDLVPDTERDTLVDRFGTLLHSYRQTLQSDRQHLLEQFRLLSMARKVVGVGSVGTRAWVLLLVGSDGTNPLLLQAKEAQESVMARFVGASVYANQGERVVAGQHLMQASSDIFLGWDQIQGLDGVRRDFYIRQLRDWKGSALPEMMDPTTMAAYGRLCGWTLARAHARSGDRIAIAAYLGSGTAFDEAIVSFSESYADQNQRDYEALQQAAASGRVVVQEGL